VSARLHLVAAGVTLLVFLWHDHAEGAECPGAEAVAAAAEAQESLVLREGCAAPFDGRLYDRARRNAVRADMVQLEEALLGAEKLLEQARAALAECRGDAADVADDCGAWLPTVSPVQPALLPHSGGGPPWVWAGAGAGVALTPLASCHFVDCGSEWTPWAVALGGSAVVVILARLVGPTTKSRR